MHAASTANAGSFRSAERSLMRQPHDVAEPPSSAAFSPIPPNPPVANPNAPPAAVEKPATPAPPSDAAAPPVATPPVPTAGAPATPMGGAPAAPAIPGAPPVLAALALDRVN